MPPIEKPTGMTGPVPRVRQHGGDVVGAVLEAEGARHRQALAVAAQVDREHPVVRREGVACERPVGVDVQRDAVQEHEHRGARGAGPLPDDNGTAAGKHYEPIVAGVRHGSPLNIRMSE